MAEGIKRRRGCLFYGAITAIVLLVFVLVAALLGLRMARKMLNEFTDTKPMPLPTVSLPAEQMSRLQARVNSFEQALHQHQQTAPLVLTSEELNALIENDPNLQPLKGKLFANIVGTQLGGQISVSLDQLGLPFFKGRWLNGHAVVGINLHDGMLRITPEAITVKGKPLPHVYMEKIQKQNLAADFNTDSRSSIALEQLQEIQVKDGKLFIVPKNQAAPK